MSNSSDNSYEALMQFLYRAPIGLAQVARDGTIEMLNPKAAQLLMPLAPGGALDNLFSLLEPLALGLSAEIDAFAEPDGVVMESRRLASTPAATNPGVVLSLTLMKLDERRLMAALADVTLEVEREARGLKRQLLEASRIDALTSLPNRSAVIDSLQSALDRPLQCSDGYTAVLFLNGDRFRRINDSFGQATGDVVLARIAERLQAALRANDQIVRGGGLPLAARLGSDEFVIVLDCVQTSGAAEAVAERLLHAISTVHTIHGQTIQATMSIGIVLQTADDHDAARLLQDAGLAMVEAKRAGGARYAVFEPEMRARAARHGALEEDLRRGLIGEQLFVVYQPVVGLQGAAVDRHAGVEALVRWRHPIRGLVNPVDFIGVAEESGLINPLGEFVLDRACSEHLKWRLKMGRLAPKRLAVNLSRAQLYHPELIDQVARALDIHQLDPGDLQLEVTESLAAQDYAIQARLAKLKSLGITLALDDFGTGYSSLASLQQLPVDTIKIDRAFVSQVDTSPHHRALVEATVKVAASLGMNTVAEGIETAEQVRVLRELGCDKGQGWHFGRPMETAALIEWIENSTMSNAND